MIVSLKVWQLVLSTAAAGQIISEGAAGRLCNSSRVQEFPKWRKCDRIRNRPTSQTRSQCSFAQPRSKANWALFSAFQSKKHFELSSSQSWSVLFAVKAEKYFVFFLFFSPGWLHWIATEVVVSQLERTCTIRSKVESSPTQSIFRWKWEKVFAFYFNVFFFMCVQIELFCFMMIISGYINLKNGKIIHNSPLDTVYHRCLLNLPINILIHLPRRRRPTSPGVVLKPAALQAPNIRRWVTSD